MGGRVGGDGGWRSEDLSRGLLCFGMRSGRCGPDREQVEGARGGGARIEEEELRFSGTRLLAGGVLGMHDARGVGLRVQAYYIADEAVDHPLGLNFAPLLVDGDVRVGCLGVTSKTVVGVITEVADQGSFVGRFRSTCPSGTLAEEGRQLDQRAHVVDINEVKVRQTSGVEIGHAVAVHRH